MITYPRKAIGIAVALFGLTLFCGFNPGHADAGGEDEGADNRAATSANSGDHDDYDDILKSVRQGKLLPLATIRAKIRTRWPGDIVAITVDQKKSGIVYEFRILGNNGRLIEVEVNAADGEILEVENE